MPRGLVLVADLAEFQWHAVLCLGHFGVGAEGMMTAARSYAINAAFDSPINEDRESPLIWAAPWMACTAQTLWPVAHRPDLN
jgi:hypothetical protein